MIPKDAVRVRYAPKNPREFWCLQVLPTNIYELRDWINTSSKQQATVTQPFDDYPYLTITDLPQDDYTDEEIVECGMTLGCNKEGVFSALEPYIPEDFEVIE